MLCIYIYMFFYILILHWLTPSDITCIFVQGLFEGAKAYRREDGHVQLFRIEENARRMKMGADRLCMPAPSVEQFVNAVKKTALANKHWVRCSPNSSSSSTSLCLFMWNVHVHIYAWLFCVCVLQVPPAGKGSLYLRPLLFGSGSVLGIGPAPEYSFIIFASPIGNWYKVGF